MSYLKRDGADIYYEVVGDQDKPTFIFVPGANGTGDIFSKAAKYLTYRFKVVMFDRRGYGKSKLTKPLPDSVSDPHDTYRIKTDAADINALAKEVSPDEPVYIMGSSSGSIVAMEVLQDFPEIVKEIAFHEPPLNSYLPNSEEHEAHNEHNVELFKEGQPKEAFMGFAKFMNLDKLDGEMMGKQDPNDTPEEQERKQKERGNWFLYEIRQYTSRKIDVESFKKYSDRINLLIGTDSLIGMDGTPIYPVKRAKELAKIWNVPYYEIPGAHLGYAQKPEGFGTTLAAVLWK